MADLPPLPPGFTLDKRPTKENAAKLPPLPPGFNLDQPQQPPAAERIYSEGGWMPVSKDPLTGEVGFDIRGGVTGAILDALGMGAQTMKDVAEGRTDPTSQEAVSGTLPGVMMMSPVGAATRATQAIVPNSLRSVRLGPVKPPTTQELKAAGSAGFKEARDMGVDYSAPAVKSVADDLLRSLEEAGFSGGPEGVSPKTFSILSKLGAVPEVEPGAAALASLSNLITVRKALQKAQKAGGEESEAARRAIGALDDFVVAATPESVVAGPAAAASKVVADARANYAAHFRAKDVEKQIYKAEKSASAANSGLNSGNRIRERLKSLLTDEKRTRGYTKEELKFLEAVVDGKFGANAARYASNFLGGGGGWGQAGTMGLAGAAGLFLGGPVGAGIATAAVPTAGLGLRVLSNALTKRSANQFADLIRTRSPLYQKALENPPLMSGLRPDVRNAVNMGLLLSAAPNGQGLQYRPPQ